MTGEEPASVKDAVEILVEDLSVQVEIPRQTPARYSIPYQTLKLTHYRAFSSLYVLI